MTQFLFSKRFTASTYELPARVQLAYDIVGLSRDLSYSSAPVSDSSPQCPFPLESQLALRSLVSPFYLNSVTDVTQPIKDHQAKLTLC